MSTILMIEDNQTLLQATSDILELAGYSVISANDGSEGVKIARESNVDLIICDIEMPGLDGYGVQKILSSDVNNFQIPFIFFSARNSQTDIRKGMDLGADDYLTKPFNKTDLLSAVGARLEKVERLKKYEELRKVGNNSYFNNTENLYSLFDLSERENLKKMKKSEVLYEHHRSANFVYFIKSGKIKVFQINEEGKEFTVMVKGTGSFLGIQSILENQTYQEDTKAIEDSEVIFVPKENLLKFIQGNPTVALELLEMMNKSSREKDNQMISLAYDSVRKRTAKTLLQLDDEYRKNSSISGDVEISISREDLASLVGTASESVIRILSDFKKANMIAVNGRRIKILDHNQLKNENF